MLEHLDLLAAIAVSGVLVYVVHTLYLRSQSAHAHSTAKQVLQDAYRDADVVLREAELNAKQAAYARQTQVDEEIRERRSEVQRSEQRLIDRDEALTHRQSLLERRERECENLTKKAIAREKMLRSHEEGLQRQSEELAAQLSRVGQMTVKDARRQLIAQTAVEARHDCVQAARRIEQQMRESLDARARHLLATAIERCAAEFASEGTVVAVALPSEEMKGRIIGREGRNIRAFEVLTGVDLIVDDTPEAILVSCFDPVRRAVAQRALEALVSDGRIHPGRIEQSVADAEVALEEDAEREARQVAADLDIIDLPEEAMKLLARLRFRSSYGQNVLQHSKDVAVIAASLASELGENSEHAKRAGLLHDIGKASDRLSPGNHVDAGVGLLKRLGEPPEVIHAIEAHHEGVEARTTLAVLLQVADRVSAARPGARRNTLESYVRRLSHLEQLAMSFEGVDRAFAIDAGRELRVIVEAARVDDDAAHVLARELARKVQSEVHFPSPIRVTVIRELRASAVTGPTR
ncbi:ribonuclease Y [Candidatus Poribacteria bacterium]|nr:ribonuclease Y [Candidatus Poribacteria bacterium]